MPKSFQQLVTVLETVPPEQCTLDVVKARLLSEYVKRWNNCETESQLDCESAFYGERSKSVFSCGKGHKKASCLMKKNTEKRKSSGNKHGEQRVVCAGTAVQSVFHSACRQAWDACDVDGNDADGKLYVLNATVKRGPVDDALITLSESCDPGQSEGYLWLKILAFRRNSGARRFKQRYSSSIVVLPWR